MAGRSIGYILKLNTLSRADIKRVGVKAANLGEMLGEGLPVPDGFVLTTEAFDKFVAANGLDLHSSVEIVASAPLPADVSEALLVSAAVLGDFPLAVRSSGVAEDLAGASYAGQYETVLDVRGAAALTAAVRRCWASAFSQRVKQYLTEHGQSGIPRIALLVQRLVQPEAAGVAFTANPVTGDSEVVVSAVRGLGERLVSGQASPDEWVVRGSDAICQRSPENALDAAQVQDIAEMARRLESYFKVPQDIEWALAGGKIYLLQARPITALPQRPEINIPDKGFWVKDHAHFPSPITPFGESVYLPAMENGISAMCRESGVLLETVQNRAIGGEVYTHAVPFGSREGPAPLSWVIFLVARLLPTFRRRRRVAQDYFDSHQPERLIKQWYGEWRGQFRDEARVILGQNLAELDDKALIEHLDKVIDFMRRGMVVHMRLTAPNIYFMYNLALACKELLGWDVAKAMSLVSGISEMSSEPGRRLAELAAIVNQSAPAQNIFAEAGPDFILQLRQAVPAIADAFQTYLDEYGCRSLDFDPGSPTLAERPRLLARLLYNMAAHRRSEEGEGIDSETSRQGEIEKARAALAHRENDLQRFNQVLSDAELAYPAREDNVFYTDNMPGCLARRAVVEFGRRLTTRGAIANAEDGVYLRDDELRTALRGEKGDFDSAVKRRKAERAWVSAHPGPMSYGKDPGTLPDPRFLPEPFRMMTRAQMWYMGLEMYHNTRTTGDKITGVSGSSGRYTGVVRIVHGESEFSRLTPGDVLVCPITTPAWSVLFAQAGAVVTDGGGVLSHAAIIAREYGIPAVLGTGDATQHLRDGQTVIVDGSAGTVQVLPAT